MDGHAPCRRPLLHRWPACVGVWRRRSDVPESSMELPAPRLQAGRAKRAGPRRHIAVQARSWVRFCRSCSHGAVLCCGLSGCTDIGASLSGASPAVDAPVRHISGGDPQRGRDVISAVGCGVCHAIPGVQNAHGIVGPPLDGFSRRQLIGGVAPNQPGILVRWIKDAPSVAPQTGMPRMPLSDQQAKHVAAYLYTLR